MQNNVKLPLFIYGLAVCWVKLMTVLMAGSSLEKIVASPLITVGAGQSPEGKMPTLGYLHCSHWAKHKQRCV